MTLSRTVIPVAIFLGTVLCDGAPTPADAGAAKASCNVASAPAAIRGRVPAETPLIASLQGATGTAKILISLSESGALLSATVAETSGNPVLDRAAVRAARAQRYSPELSDCRLVNGSYVVTVEFHP